MGVAVVIPAYNAAPHLAETLESVAMCSPAASEVVVVDDGSSDATAEVAKRWTRRHGGRLVQQANAGVAAARNAGFAALQEDVEHVLFLDADDLLGPSTLGRLGDALDADPTAVAAFCDVAFIDAAGAPAHRPANWPQRWERSRLGARRTPPDEPRTSFFALFNVAPVLPSATLVRQDAFARSGGFDPTFGQPYEDLDLCLRLALSGHFLFVAEPLVRYRQHGTQNTADHERLMAQHAQLYARWRELDRLDPADRDVVRRAWRDRRRHLIPSQRLGDARDALRQRRWGWAARHVGAAARGKAGLQPSEQPLR